MPTDAPVILVTGGARRVGRAIVERFAADGWSVAIHCHQSVDAAEELAASCRRSGVAAAIVTGDLVDPAVPAKLIDTVTERLGRLDCLVNNASIFERGPLADVTAADFDRHIAVNLRAPLLLAQAAADSLRAAGGLIVNLSDAALARPWTDHVAYVLSKGGIDTLTALLARELAPRVRVVGVAPGVAAWPDDYDEQTRARLIERIPLKRAGTPDDIAGLVRFLAGEGGYITGTTIPVDGGRHIA